MALLAKMPRRSLEARGPVQAVVGVSEKNVHGVGDGVAGTRTFGIPREAKKNLVSSAGQQSKPK
jgi:hypothetical protein